LLANVCDWFFLLFRAIGHGAFGKVCEGVLHNMPGETTDTLVAVKVLYQLLSVYFYLSFFVEEKGSVFISVPLSVRPLTML